MVTKIQDLSDCFVRISQCIQSESAFDQVALKILQELGGHLNTQWGTYWKVDEKLHQLLPLVTWTLQGFSAPELHRDTEHRSLSISEGTAGHVWRSGKPVWTLDILKDMCLPRSLDANKSGLTAGLWFSLKTDHRVFAVIELLGRDLAPPTLDLVRGIESFGVQIGELLQKRHEKGFETL